MRVIAKQRFARTFGVLALYRDGERRPAKRRRFVFVALFVAVALVLSACIGLADKTPETCDCSTLEATVASIDWTGDGRIPDETRQSVGSAGSGQLPLVASAVYRDVTSVVERDELFEYVVSVMNGIRIAPIDGIGFAQRDRKAIYVGDGWTLFVSTRASEERLSVVVSAEKPDERTPEYLATLIDAFGTG